MLKRKLCLILCLVMLLTTGFVDIPFVKDGGIQKAAAANSLITKSGNTWTLENDSMRVVLSFANGSIQMTSYYNKEAGKEYLTGSGSSYLFYYNYGGSDLYSNDGGWTLGADSITDISQFNTNWGKTLSIPITRVSPQNLTVTLKFDIYNGRAGVRYRNFIKNNTAAEKTITNSDVIALNFPNNAHTLYYVPNMTWYSTSGALAPNAGKNCITLYDTGDGWGLQPEMNWKTETTGTNYMLPPFANINAWSGIANVKVSTNPESMQLVLFPNEELEYLSVNLTVFKGDIIDGKMAVEEHFRKRFKYNNVTSIFTTNDWDWLGNRTDAYYRNTVVPKAVQGGLDMIMVDDLWNTTRDSTAAKTSFTTNMASLTDYIVSQGLKFGIWFSMTGDDHNKGRDLADPANIEYKRSQVEDVLISQYHVSHQMIDLTEFWPNTATTTTSHPSDSIYRKNLNVRNYLNGIVSRHPEFIPKLTSEVDIYPTQGDRNNGLLHIADNGFITANGGVASSNYMTIPMDSFGYLPMNSVYYGGSPTGKMQDYYPLMLTRIAKFNTDPGGWSDTGLNLLKKFNDWRKSPRIKALTEETCRPLYAGPNFDISGPFAWMYRTEDKSKALVIASAAKMTGAPDEFTMNMRWLDSNKTYLVEDITLDDNGTNNYIFKGRFTGAQLKSPGLTVNLAENTSKGKAFYIQEDNGASMQVLYADEKITSYTQAVGTSGITVNVNGAANSTGKVIVFDRTANKCITGNVAIGSTGTGSVVIDSGIKFEAESLPITTSTGDTNTTAADTAASNGSLNYAGMNAVGDFIQYTVNVPSAGTYNVKAQVKKHPDRGMAQLYIDGVAQGAPIDEYQSTQGYVEVDLGTIAFTSAGNKQFKFQVTGKNASSNYYTLATDYIRLTYKSPDIVLPPAVPEPVKYECESITKTVSSGDTYTDASDSAASNNGLNYAGMNAVGDWIQFPVTVAAAGTYNVKVQVKKHPSRGTAQLYIDGAAQGAPIDEYQSAQAYVTMDLGNVTFTSAGTKQFKFQVTGKNASSDSYTLATDYISLTAQPYSFECENLATTVSAGDSFANSADAAASNGSLSFSGFNAVGDWVQYAVNVPQAGTYTVSARVKKHPDRGTAQLYVDGTAVGTPVDYAQNPASYVNVCFGNVTFSSAGDKQFKLQITGKDPSSNSYQLANDKIMLTRVN